ncbi:MAG: ATP-dependent DNA helicase [Acidimicrobiia bacterium]
MGPAGTGKTTALRRAADDLARQRRRVFGVAPTAKAAKVLHDETSIPADTVAKLLYEWRDGRPRAPYALAPGTTVVVDEAGMLGTSSLDLLVALAAAQRWRLVLVGDPRQLQAVGRGGMFDELCRSGRVHELATIHRFRHRWEQTATLRLRHGRAEALDAYFDHDRVESGDLPALLDDVARRWSDDASAGRSVAVTAETNEHVAALNAAIQRERDARGDLGSVGARVADGATASTGDIVVTRRNDRTLITDNGQPVRNRERWCVAAVHGDGQLTVSHIGGHGMVTLPADYVRTKVELGYAGTAHGHQGDTVEVSLTLITAATSHRSLYVGATRGRDENRLLVVTSGDDEARDVLEHVLTNDRVDLPAVAQRRVLADQVRGERGDDVPDGPERTLARARRALEDARRNGAPAVRRLGDASAALQAADAEARAARRALRDAPRLRRRGPTERVKAAAVALAAASDRYAAVARAAAPFTSEIEARKSDVERAERAVSAARLRDRLDRLATQRPARSLGRAPSIPPPGR